MIHGLEQLYRPPRLGVIRLGVKVQNRDGGGEHPVEVPYFVLPDELRALVPAKPGTEGPTVLEDIRLPFNDPRRNLHSVYYETRRGRFLTSRCDGVECVEIPLEGPEKVIACEKNAKDIWDPCPRKCRARAKLSIMVPLGRVGLWEIPVGGLRRIADLLGEMEMFALQFGRLTGIPFALERQPTEENYRKGDDTRAARTGYPVHLRCALTGQQAALIAGSEVAIPPSLEMRPAPAALPPGPTVLAPSTSTSLRIDTRAEHVEDDPVPGDDNGDEWDVSVAFTAAARLGVSAVMYERYLQHQYQARSGDLSDEDVRRERRRLENPGDGQAVKRLVAEMAMVASGGRRGA